MSDTAVDRQAEDAEPVVPRRPTLVTVLVAVIAVALLAVAVVVGYAWGNSGGSSTPSTSSVDAGFARDMSTHHQQAITMAGYTRDNTDSSAIKTIAFDIETSQLFQVGEMQGWLDDWRLSRAQTNPMAWMAGHGHVVNGLMPGMATPDQLTKLETLHGKALDTFFLQLMIHHHQGGIAMAQYAAAHAQEQYVRDLAQAMYTAQSGEIVQMEQLLRSLGGQPLPAPEN